MIWIILLAGVQVLGIISAVHAVMQVRTSQGAIAWAVSLLSLPAVALPLYWILGRNKFQGMAEAHRAHAAEIEERIALVRVKLEPYVGSAELGPSERSLEALVGMPILGQNEVTLLVDGSSTFDDIIAGIERAEQHVLVQFYIVRADGLGRRLAEAMASKAEAGVPVYFLYDEIGSMGLPATYLQTLSAAGVHVSKFNTTRGRANRFQLNFRNHRKIVVVDGHEAWIGGHNVGDEYLGLNPKRGPWRDTHMRIAGPAAMEAQATFVGDWLWATDELLRLFAEPRALPGASARVLIAATAPSTKLETASLIAVELLHLAKTRIWIASPYFVPDRAVMAALRGAALRGVEVRVMIAGESDNMPVHLAAHWYIDALDGVGIRFFRYTAGFLHQKVVLVDDRVSSVGTVNWDSRSFRLNFEVSALVEDKVFAKEVETMLEADFARCVEVESGELAKKSFFFRLAVQSARLMSPVL